MDAAEDVVVVGAGPAGLACAAQLPREERTTVPDDAEGALREIRYEAILPVPPDRAFEFVSDPGNWPVFFHAVRSAEASSQWGRPGGRGHMVTAFLGRMVHSDLELTEWDPPRGFRYTARQRGRPDLDNRRVFAEVAGGTRLIGTTRIPARRGLHGAVDRLSLRVLHRAYGEAMARLPHVLREP
jgi:uncharacterized protein YndB with AHSA1/START domain